MIYSDSSCNKVYINRTLIERFLKTDATFFKFTGILEVHRAKQEMNCNALHPASLIKIRRLYWHPVSINQRLETLLDAVQIGKYFILSVIELAIQGQLTHNTIPYQMLTDIAWKEYSWMALSRCNWIVRMSPRHYSRLPIAQYDYSDQRLVEKGDKVQSRNDVAVINIWSEYRQLRLICGLTNIPGALTPHMKLSPALVKKVRRSHYFEKEGDHLAGKLK